jgi:hypothetical protein
MLAIVCHQLLDIQSKRSQTLRRCFKSLRSSRTSVNLCHAAYLNSTQKFMSLSKLRRWHTRRCNICTVPAELLAEQILFLVNNQVGKIVKASVKYFFQFLCSSRAITFKTDSPSLASMVMKSWLPYFINCSFVNSLVCYRPGRLSRPP